MTTIPRQAEPHWSEVDEATRKAKDARKLAEGQDRAKASAEKVAEPANDKPAVDPGAHEVRPYEETRRYLDELNRKPVMERPRRSFAQVLAERAKAKAAETPPQEGT